MIALTIRQPFAWAVVEGIKPVENRSRTLGAQNRIGELIAIHAGVANGPQVQAELARWGNAASVPWTRLPQARDLAFGCVIGAARITRVIEQGDGDELNASRWRTSDRYGIVWRDVRPIEPIVCAGKLGLWALPPRIAEQVAERYAATREAA